MLSHFICRHTLIALGKRLVVAPGARYAGFCIYDYGVGFYKPCLLYTSYSSDIYLDVSKKFAVAILFATGISYNTDTRSSAFTSGS